MSVEPSRWQQQAERWRRIDETGHNKHFQNISEKRSQRADMHALMSIEAWLPGRRANLISGAMVGRVWLNVDAVDLEDLTDEQLAELSCCGVRYSPHGLYLSA